MQLDHVAVIVHDISQSVSWYQSQFAAKILYQDQSWAFLQLGSTKLALVLPGKHPAHIAVAVTLEELEVQAAKAGQTVEPHRDGTKGIYIQDPSGNAVELICYPPGQTAYSKKD